MAKKRKTTKKNLGGVDFTYTTESRDNTKKDSYNPLKNIADEMGDFLKGHKREFSQGKFSFFTILGNTINLSEAERRFTSGKFKTAGSLNLKPGVQEDVDFFVSALQELQDILTNKRVHTTIVRQAYNNTIRPVLERRVGEPSLSRDGSGRQFKTPYKGRSGEELGGKWKEIYKKITGPISLQSTSGGVLQFYAFNLEELLSVRMTSKASKFTSVFMMAEFGTGQFADTPSPRFFKSAGSTPFKVDPFLGSIIRRYGGCSSSTAQWYSQPSKATAIIRLHLQIVKLSKSLSSGNIEESDRRKLDFGTLRKIGSKERRAIQKKILRNQNLINYIIAAHIFGDRSAKAISPRHILFSSRGVVLEVQRVYKKFLLEYARLLNDLIRSRIGDVWSPNGFRVTLPERVIPFDFDILKQQMNT